MGSEWPEGVRSWAERCEAANAGVAAAEMERDRVAFEAWAVGKVPRSTLGRWFGVNPRSLSRWLDRHRQVLDAKLAAEERDSDSDDDDGGGDLAVGQ